MNDNAAATEGRAYLHVMARYKDTEKWHIFRVSDEPPRIAPAFSVMSYDEAKREAMRARQPLRFAVRAWQQMVDAGVAPRRVPDQVTIVQ